MAVPRRDRATVTRGSRAAARPGWLKPLVFIACLAPGAWLALALVSDRLSANPIDDITDATGIWALRLLLLSLLMSPLRRGFGWSWPPRLRRMLGLFGFFYAGLHLLTYLWLDQFFDWRAIAVDLLERPFITLGMLAFALLLPLAATSTRAAMRRLGRHWQHLHRLAYVAPVLAVWHYFWLVKADLREPLIHALLLGLLLALRWPALRRPGGAGQGG